PPSYEFWRDRDGGRLRIHVSSAAAGFLLALAHELEREASPRLRLCPEKNCGRRLFYRIGRQVYCPAKWNDRPAQRARRERKAEMKRQAATGKKRTIRRHRTIAIVG